MMLVEQLNIVHYHVIIITSSIVLCVFVLCTHVSSMLAIVC